MVSPGTQLDLSFTLKVVREGLVEVMRFADLLTRPTVVSVYMRNNTPSCDRQNDRLSEAAVTLEGAGLNLVALSRDTIGSHRRYAAARRINYILASDPHDQFARATDSLVPKSMYGRSFTGPSRSAYLLDRDGSVLAVVQRVDPVDHAAQLNELIKHYRK